LVKLAKGRAAPPPELPPAPSGREETAEAAFAAYYQRQAMLPAAEWPGFLAALHRPLPVTFRLAIDRCDGASPLLAACLGAPCPRVCGTALPSPG
jgi:hypothetical protein